MIVLKSHGRDILVIDESSIQKILSIYPDEHLMERPVFVSALDDSELSYTTLRHECETLLIPWQLFLLEASKLDLEIEKMDERRKAKFESRLIASRDNEGGGISLRIADRLIALQDFAKEEVHEGNAFDGSLKNVHRDSWPQQVLDFFEIDTDKLKSGRKQQTLDYLISKVESKNIRVARGVLSNKLLPVENKIRSTYRKSSGFVVKDEKVPYIFLPSEVSDNETPGRQILTLFALLLLIGLEQYNLYITGTLELIVQRHRTLRQIFGAVSDILLPFEESDKYKCVQVTPELRDSLASTFMLTPSAIVVTLRQRDLISDAEYDALLGSIQGAPPTAKAHRKNPRIDTSVKKLCGAATHSQIINGLKAGTLSAINAQYLMFGRIDKLRFEKYKANVGL
jgi:hypothetical protein